MEVVRAKYLGFCAGVKRAMNIVEDAIEYASSHCQRCYIYGDIVHNKIVMDRIHSAGVVSISSPDDTQEPGVLIIRTHGIKNNLLSLFKERGFLIWDATCGVVKRNQSLLGRSSNVIIVGIPGHAEIEALEGSANGNYWLISSAGELSTLDRGISYNAIIQTTFSSKELARIKEKATELGLDISFLSSICDSSKLRREAVLSLVPDVDAVVVVGDRGSTNTNELVSSVKKAGRDAFLVEEARCIPEEVKKYKKVAITAGASTPDDVWQDVEKALCAL